MTIINKTCRECGSAFEAKKAWGEFCSTKHRQDFDNRQSSRGGELYAFAMNWRYGEGRDGKRPDGKSKRTRDKEALQILVKLMEAFHAEDEAERAGRPSYRPTKLALAKLGGHRGGLDRLPGCGDGRSKVATKVG